MSHAQQELATAYRKSAIFLIGVGLVVALAGEGFLVLLIMGAALVLVRPVFQLLASIG